MASKTSLPVLDYTGQTTPELLECKESHRIDSLLCAFEEGIQAKVRLPRHRRLTEDENLVLAVMALDREVNNGGYHQFFLNSSVRFVPVIVDCLHRIGCAATEALTRRAIAALELPELTADAASAKIRTRNRKRDRIIDDCDREFYRLDEITPRLFAYIEAHQDRIQLVRATVPPRERIPQLGNAAKLFLHLRLAKQPGLTLDGARQLAREYAKQQSLAATEAEVEGAAVLFAFFSAIRARDLAAAAPLAQPAFELMHEDTTHSILRRAWVVQLIDAAKLDLADASTRAYLEYLNGCDQSACGTYNRILFWAEVLKKHAAVLPISTGFFATHFPAIDLFKPLPPPRYLER